MTALQRKNAFSLLELVVSITILSMISLSLLSFFQSQQKVQENVSTLNIQNTLNRLLNNYYALNLNYPTEEEFLNQLKNIAPNLEILQNYLNPKCKNLFLSVSSPEEVTQLNQLGWGIQALENNPNKIYELIAFQNDCVTPAP